MSTLPTAASLTGSTTTNAQQKTNFSNLRNVIAEKVGTTSGLGPVTVASASSIDLTAVTTVKDLVISGVTPVDDFVIAAGDAFDCVASGAFTLVNSSDIVTNTGANLVCAAGDSFRLRATATNVVEVLGFVSAASLPGASKVPGLAPAFACRAWVNFDGTGVVTIRGSGNVSSITDNGAGDYTVNFTTAMPDANYSLQASLGASAVGQNDRLIRGYQSSGTGYQASSARIECYTAVGAARVDADQICVAVFR